MRKNRGHTESRQNALGDGTRERGAVLARWAGGALSPPIAAKLNARQTRGPSSCRRGNRLFSSQRRLRIPARFETRTPRHTLQGVSGAIGASLRDE
jgi:hypothetical protein